ncbi:DNA topoisomerase 3 [Labrenzia sp. THAF82]|uniref:DNA topoisomerase n=1 Tax=Labrenzia sp. THAF82 TaxID=2587861 RepID=UPI001268BB53|nr:DNA topoisomerase [Labrenzia sp. THAF82]QFT29573.1 DNA topoisomerase 3 [Labrenzia sp. THAF82]
MTSIVITEKPSQARNVMAAVGTRYGQVLAAQGHLLRLQQPEEVNEAWKKWEPLLLKPDSGFYGLVADRANGKGARLDQIKAALTSADRVYIATDCDREGQAIGQNLLRFFRFKGAVLRVMFTAEDEKTLQEAFAGARPNEEYRSLYLAAEARSQADQIYNLSLTRTATTTLVPRGVRQVIGIGRVRTPTLAIVCRREADLAAFKARDYYELVAVLEGDCGPFELRHAPKAEARYFDKAKAEDLARSVQGWQGPVSVVQQERRQPPGKPMDLPSLQKRAATWGWTAQKTLEVAQSLYETHKVTTYPRAATRFLPENLIEGSTEVFRALVGMDDVPVDWSDPVIRTGRKRIFCTAGLEGESHHAIIPNPAKAGELASLLPNLSGDERRLFDLIAKTFLAALGPDHVYLKTEVSLTVAADGGPIVFNTVGRQTREPGWKAVYAPYLDKAREAEDAVELPALEHGAPVAIRTVGVESKKTTAPARYTEGSLIEAMQNAWKFVEAPDQQARLKAAKGIGTPATRDTIIEGLKRQGFLETVKGKLQASGAAMDLYRILSAKCPQVLDPASTAHMENRLDDILRGTANARSVVNEICASAQSVIEALTASDERLALKRKPSEAMVKAAKAKAARTGTRLSRAQLGDYDALRAFLGPLPSNNGPSNKDPSNKDVGRSEVKAAS